MTILSIFNSGCRAVPARRQRRIFDDTREAEKVVQWVAGLSPADVAQLLLPTLLQVSNFIYRIYQ